MNSGRRLSLDRLKGRSVREVAFRARQWGAVVLERAGWLDQREWPAGQLYARLTPAVRARHPSLAAWVRAFRRDDAHCVRGLRSPRATAALVACADPAAVDRVIDRAEAALRGELDLLGLGRVQVEIPIDWQRDPIAGITAPSQHWSRVPYLDPKVAGDHKCTWEVNRHQWLVSLGQAWVLTGDDRFARAVDTQLAAWMDGNPPKIGVNWASSLEVAFRAIAWIWTLRLVADAPAVRDETIGRALGHLVLSARHLERNLSTYFSPNTHLTGEALGLYAIGTALADLTPAARWRNVGRRVLLEWLPRHIRADGTYVEQSTWYLRYTSDFFAYFAILAEAVGDGVAADAVRDAVGRAGRVLAAVIRPDGTFPLIGDDDGGRLSFLDGRSATDARPALALAAHVAGDETLAGKAGGATAEVTWLTGAIPLRGESPPPPPGLQWFRDGGLVVIRGTPGHQLVVDAGRHGFLNAGHAHADALSFDLTLGGAAAFVDPGTYLYTANPEVRDRFRATASHNAATFEGRSSSLMAGAFAWASQAETTIAGQVGGPWGGAVSAHHDGFGAGAAGGRYRRDLLFLAEGILVVRDAMDEGPAGTMVSHLQCAIGTCVRPVGDRWVVSRDGVAVAEVLVADPGAAVTVQEGEVSAAYGMARQAPRLRIAAAPGTHPVLHVVVSPPLGVAAAWQEGTRGRCIELVWGDRTDRVGFGPFSRDDMAMAVDAAMWWVRVERAVPSAWMALGATRVEGRGLASWRAAHATDVTMHPDT